MATIKERLEQEKRDFTDALSGKFEVNGRKMVLSRAQAQFIRDAIPSIDYMLLIFKGDVALPKESENVESSWGKVFGYMRGSIINITMAEAILYGKWKNIRECFEVDNYSDDGDDDGYTSLADEVNADNEVDDDIDDDDDDRYTGLADEVNAGSEVDDDSDDDDDDRYTGLADEVNAASEVGDDSEEEDDDDYYTWHPRNRARDDIDCDEGICDCCDC